MDRLVNNYLQKNYHNVVKAKDPLFTKAVTLTNQIPDLLEMIVDYIALCPEKLNKKNYKGSTPLALACYTSNTTSTESTVRLLLELGADPNISDDDGWTPLMIAVAHSQTSSTIKTVRMLLCYGADPNSRTKQYKNTALVLCVKLTNYVFELLIDKTNLNFEYAGRNILRCVLENAEESKHKILFVQKLISKKVDCNVIDCKGRTLLDFYIDKNKDDYYTKKIFKILLKSGAVPLKYKDDKNIILERNLLYLETKLDTNSDTEFVMRIGEHLNIIKNDAREDIIQKNVYYDMVKQKISFLKTEFELHPDSKFVENIKGHFESLAIKN